MSKILVTGGLGYIGSHTVVELQNEGHQVVIIDNLNNTELKVKDRIESITGQEVPTVIADVNDELALDKLFTENNFDGVIHFDL